MSEKLCNTEYRCPGESYSISCAVHLARLGNYYPACRECARRDDTAGLSTRQVRRLADVSFAAEGICRAAINDLSPQLARTIAIDFARRLADSRAAKPPTIAFASDGRLTTATIVAAIVEGIRWSGCTAVDFGAASAPCMARAMEHIAADGGIYLGNPGGAAHTLGVKFWVRGERVSPDETLETIARRMGFSPPLSAGGLKPTPHDRPTRSFGPLRRIDAAEVYLNDFRPAYHALRPLRFVLQCGCGPVVSYLENLLQNVACRIIPAGPGKGDCAGQILAAKAHFGMTIADDGESGCVFDEQGQSVAEEGLLALVRDVGAVARKPAETTCASDALSTVTLLLVRLSRDDSPLSAVLDRHVGGE